MQTNPPSPWQARTGTVRPVEPVTRPADAVGEHHAYEIVPVEHERLVDRPGGDDDASRAHPEQERACRDGNEPSLVHAEGAAGCDHLESLRGERAAVLVDEQHALAPG